MMCTTSSGMPSSSATVRRVQRGWSSVASRVRTYRLSPLAGAYSTTLPASCAIAAAMSTSRSSGSPCTASATSAACTARRDHGLRVRQVRTIDLEGDGDVLEALEPALAPEPVPERLDCPRSFGP